MVFGLASKKTAYVFKAKIYGEEGELHKTFFATLFLGRYWKSMLNNIRVKNALLCR